MVSDKSVQYFRRHRGYGHEDDQNLGPNWNSREGSNERGRHGTGQQHAQPPDTRLRTTDDAEGTALVIGCVAAILIAIILVVLLVLKFKSRTEVVFGKVIGEDDDAGLRGLSSAGRDSGRRYEYGDTGMMGSTSTTQYAPPARDTNDGYFNQQGACGSTEALRPGRVKTSKDVKEWYV